MVRPRILVVLDNCGPGDALRLNFCLNLIRQHYDHSRITLLAGEQTVPVIQNSQLYDRLVISRLYEQRSRSLWRLRFRKLKELVTLPVKLGHGYDLVITLGWGSTLLNGLGWLLARRRIGYANALPQLLSSRLGRYDFGFQASMIDQQLELLIAAGIPAAAAAPVTIHGSDDEAAVESLLHEHGLAASDSRVVLHPGSDWACQQWLPERWAALADRIVTEYGAAIIFTGRNDEQEYINHIRSRMNATSVSFAGKTSLPVLGALLAGARLCVCVDSAAYELALGTRVPTVVLAGPSDTLKVDQGSQSPVILNRTSPQLKEAILKSKAVHDMHGGCLNYACPMAGLRDIQLVDVLGAIASHGVLERVGMPTTGPV